VNILNKVILIDLNHFIHFIQYDSVFSEALSPCMPPGSAGSTASTSMKTSATLKALFTTIPPIQTSSIFYSDIKGQSTEIIILLSKVFTYIVKKTHNIYAIRVLCSIAEEKLTHDQNTPTLKTSALYC